LVEVVGNSTKSDGSDSEKTCKDLGGRATLGGAGLTRSLQRLDQVTSVIVGVVGGTRRELFFTLGRLLIETLTDFKNFICVLLVAVILLVRV